MNAKDDAEWIGDTISQLRAEVKHYRNALMTPGGEQTMMKDEFGWVIERADSSAAEPKYWAAGQVDAARSSAWTSNHMQAIRFARELDASRVADRIMKGIDVRICEHGWSSAHSGGE